MNVKTLAAAAVTATSLLTGLAATGTAHAATPAAPAAVAPAGYVTQAQCTSMAGSIHFTPGLTKVKRTQTAVLSATLDGCSVFGTGYAGTGTLSATLAGKASKTAQSLTGNFVINWPAASGLNPSLGTLTVNLVSGQVSLTGYTSSSTGAFEASAVSGGYFVTGHQGRGTKAHPITSETFVNTLPLTVSHNLG